MVSEPGALGLIEEIVGEIERNLGKGLWMETGPD
jgi:hypothetical protein